VTALLPDDHPEERARDERGVAALRLEHGGDAVVPARRDPAQRLEALADAHAADRDLALQELVGDLDEDSGAVAARRIGPGRAAVLHLLERGDPAGDDVVGRSAPQLREEPHPARVMLETWLVEVGVLRELDRAHF